VVDTVSGRPPVILIGMHRSGTSLMTRVLARMGLFVGAERDPNEEALFFLRINRWLVRQAGGAWDRPAPVLDLLAHRDVRRLAHEHVERLMRSPKAASYLGLHQYLRHRGIRRIDAPWGWKDPRNTFTLPLWLDLFPDARVIHVCRHGVDVARSLLVRHQKVVDHAKRMRGRARPFDWVRFEQGPFADTVRCSTLEGGFDLWDEYVRQASDSVRALGDQAMEVRFEEFVADPRPWLVRMSDFCGLDARNGMIDEARAIVRQGRSFGYRRDPVLQAFAQRMGPRLSVVGYTEPEVSVPPPRASA